MNSNQNSCFDLEMPDYRVVGAALAGLGLVGISYLFQKGIPLRGRVVGVVAKSDALPILKPKLGVFQALQKNYQGLYKKQPPCMKIFEEDAPMLESLLMKWILSSKLRFFHFLGLNIYNECKSEGVSEEDLMKFCAVYQKLSEEMFFSYLRETKDSFFDEIHKDFLSISPLISDKARPNFLFLLKILQHPEKARVFEKSLINHFDRNEGIDGDFSRKEDVKVFLDFVNHLYPKEFGFIKTSQKDATLSRKLNDVLNRMQSVPNFVNDRVEVTRYDFITFVKLIVDYRLLEKKIPIERLITNISLFNETILSKDDSYWFKKMYRDYLSTNYEKGFAMLNIPSQSLTLKLNNKNILLQAYPLLMIFVNEARIKSMPSFEKSLLIKLEHEREKCKGHPEKYAMIFANIVRLYQIIHDVHFLKDATQDQLEGKHIPDSLADLAFLPEINATEELEQSYQAELTPLETKQNASASSTHSMDQDLDALPKIKVKTRPAINIVNEETPAVTFSNTLVASNVEKTDFPSRNVSGKTVMRHLFNHGFVIEGIEGSHYQLHHILSHVKLTVPYHESLKPKTLHSIRKAFYLSQGYDSN